MPAVSRTEKATKEVGDTGFGLLGVRLPIYFFLCFCLASSAQPGGD
jgi:hypothetical protein